MQLHSITLAAIALGTSLVALYSRRAIRSLSYDSAFGISTRAAFDQYARTHTGSCDVIFIDLDKIHDLNHAVGEDEVDRRVRVAIQHRASDRALYRTRYKSGDELLFLVPLGDGLPFAERLHAQFTEAGLSATIAVEACVCGDLLAAIAPAQRRVYAAKVADQRGRIAA
jgi:GGDEF domain-containing protein